MGLEQDRSKQLEDSKQSRATEIGICGRCPGETGLGKLSRARLWKICNTRLRSPNFVYRNREPMQRRWRKERKMSGRAIRNSSSG